MCRIKTLLLSSVMLLAALLVGSCDKGEIGAIYEGESGFAFASSVLYAEVSKEDSGILEIPIYKGKDGVANRAQIEFHYDTAPAG